MTKRLKVSGMHCTSCSMLVDMTLEELDGVQSAQTDHASGESIVTFDSDVVGSQTLVEAVRKVGYDAEAVD
jgi:copper chaperone CopZ